MKDEKVCLRDGEEINTYLKYALVLSSSNNVKTVTAFIFPSSALAIEVGLSV